MRLGALVTAGALTFGLSACSGADDDGADDQTPVASTADDAATDSDTGGSTQDAAGTSESGTASGSGAEAAEGEEIPVADFLAMLREPGEETLSSYTMTMTMDDAGQPVEVDGAVDLSGEAAAMRIVMGVPDLGEVELLLVDGTMYMAMEGLVPDGKYIEAPPELTQDLQDLDDIEVSAMWDTWEDSAEKVVYLGEDDVDGTDMRRYEVTVDGEALDASLRTAAEQLGDDAAATSLAPQGPVVYDVWLDEDNLIRQLEMDVEGSMLLMTLDNWGEPQDITAPSGDQLVDLSELGGSTG